jgi:catechol 2,3-dioxygenase-like lactoylglutathione lyase family enzyme
MESYITGVQQAGIGVPDIDKYWPWYSKMFGLSVAIFDDRAEAALMTPYTGGEVHSRRAVLALNMAGGGGAEIWQFTSRTPGSCSFNPVYGDLGLFALKIKTRNIKSFVALAQSAKAEVSEILTDAKGRGYAWVKDPMGNIFQVVEISEGWFGENGNLTGGIFGAVIGVSSVDKSLPFYQTLLGTSGVVFDEEAKGDKFVDAGSPAVRRLVLSKTPGQVGAFSQLLGGIELELVERKDKAGKRIFDDTRYWGDCGFIHLCFDVLDMEPLQKVLNKAGHKFTIDSKGTFAMGEAGGRFAYVEDPDGALIELVETHKIPIMKKYGWFLDLTKRKGNKPLAKWMFKVLAMASPKAKALD